jgi:hypothetical protein
LNAEPPAPLLPREREPWIAAAAVYAVLVAVGTKLARAADVVHEADTYAPLLALPAGLGASLLVAAGFILLVHALARLAGPSGAALAGGALLSWGMLEALSVVYLRLKGAPITLAVLQAPGPLLDLEMAAVEDRVAGTLLFVCAGLALPALLRTAAQSSWLCRAAHLALPVGLGLVGLVLLLAGTPGDVAPDLGGSALVTLVQSALRGG